SVMTPDRRQRRAKKNTVETPVSTNAHHCQLPATPYCRTCCVTQFGVSLLNVVATIESPASHQGTDLPAAKNSDVFFPANLPKNSAGKKQTTRVMTTMTQSISWRCICEAMICQAERTSAAGDERRYSSENLYPTQGSVRMYCGRAGSRSSLRRSELTRTRRC